MRRRSPGAVIAVAVVVASLWPAPAPATDEPPFQLYKHVVATDLASADFRAGLLRADGLVTIRGAQGPTPGLPELMQAKDGLRVLLYRRGTAVGDADAATLSRQHPDWVPHDERGHVVRSNAGATVIDVTNPAVRRWLVDGIVTDVRALSYDGVYLDVLGSFFSERFYSGRPVIGGAPVADTAWRDGCIALVQEVKAATGKPVVANGFGLESGTNYLAHKADSDLLIAAVDGIQIEQFTRTGKADVTRGPNLTRWKNDVDFVSHVGDLGKLVLVNTRVAAGQADSGDTPQVRIFAEASFLLAARGRSLFQFGGDGGTDLDVPFAGNLHDLGAPRGDAVPDGGAFRRAFANGVAAVNPGNKPAAVQIDGNTVDLAAGGATIWVGGHEVATTGASTGAGPTPTRRSGRRNLAVGRQRGGSNHTSPIVFGVGGGVIGLLGGLGVIRLLQRRRRRTVG